MIRMFGRAIPPAVGLALLVQLPGLASADGILRDSMGGRTSGRAGTNIAHHDNGAVAYSNPAGIVNIEGSRLLEARLDVYTNGFDYRDPENPHAKSQQLPAFLPEATWIEKLPGGRVAIGGTVVVPGGFGTEYRINNPALGKRIYRSNSLLAKILPVVAVRITDRWSVGASLGLGINQVRLKSPYHVQTRDGAGALAEASLSGWGFAPTWSLGTQFRASDRLQIGFAYVSSTDFQSHGDANLESGDVRTAYDAEIRQKFPQSAALGMRYLFSGGSVASFDLTWFDWSSSFHHIGFDFDRGAPAGFPTSVQDELTLNWRDSWGVRLGYERPWRQVILRGGYGYHSSPVPASRVTPLVPGILEHVFALGIGTSRPGWNVDLAYQYSFGSAHTPGDSEFVGGDFDDSSLFADSNVVFLSLIRAFP